MPTRIKGLKAVLVLTQEQQEQVYEFMQRQNKLNLYASKHLHKMLINDIQVDVKVKPERIFLNAQAAVRRLSPAVLCSASARWLKRHTEIDEMKNTLGLPYADNIRCATYLSGRFYKGIGQRGKDKIKGTGKALFVPKNPAIPKAAKSLYVLGSMFKKVFTDNGQLTWHDSEHESGLVDVIGLKVQLNLHDGIKFDANIRIPRSQTPFLNFIEYNKKKLYCDSNLINDNGGYSIVLLIKEQYDYAYEPEVALGLDLNRRADCFITLSGEYGKIALRPHLKEMVDKVKEANTAIAEYKGRKRTKRLQWFEARNKLRKAFNEEVDAIVNLAKEKKALVCVDGITLAQSGTFGHAELVESLKRRLDKENMPYVMVKTPNTSKDCYNCLTADKKYVGTARHTNFSDSICPVCMQKFDADTNAANNIAYDGWQLFDGGKILRPSSKENPRPKQNYKKLEALWALQNDVKF